MVEDQLAITAKLLRASELDNRKQTSSCDLKK